MKIILDIATWIRISYQWSALMVLPFPLEDILLFNITTIPLDVRRYAAMELEI